MKEPSTYEKIHWRIFNIGARLFGVGLSFVSLVFIITHSMDLASISNFYNVSKVEGIITIVVFFLLFLLGIAFLKVKPFFPKEYKEWFEKKDNKIKMV